MFLLPALACAHPDAGLLPDAVAEMEYRMVVDLNPRDIATRNKLGIVLYRKGKLKDAQQEFGAVLALAPRDFDAHDGMGLVKLKERRYDEAVAWFTRAISLRPDDTMVHYNLGYTYEQMGRFKEARASYERSLGLSDAALRRGTNRQMEETRHATILASLKGVRERTGGARK